MNKELVESSINEYGFSSFVFPTEIAESVELQQLDMNYCRHSKEAGESFAEMCKDVAAIHAKLARAGRYGGGQWLAWCEARGLNRKSADRMRSVGERFNMDSVSTLKNVEDIPRTLLYAASKPDVTPVTWEFITSDDSEKREIGKKLMECEKQIHAAREDMRKAWDEAKAIWKKLSRENANLPAAQQIAADPTAPTHWRTIAQMVSFNDFTALEEWAINDICHEYGVRI